MKLNQKRSRRFGMGLLLVFLAPTLYAQINRSFPQEGNTPCFGIKPNNRTQENLNAIVISNYTQWVADYMMESTTVSGDYKINYDGTGATVSEAMGYGMLFTAWMAGADANAKLYFDGLNQFRKRYPSSINPNLMEWKIWEDEISRQDDCATDGDLDMAMALLLAHTQWGDPVYFQEATNLIHAIANSLIRPDKSIRLGDWNTAAGQTRTSDFLPTHFRSFYLATKNPLWQLVETQCYSILEQLQTDYAPATGLFPDFAVTQATHWVPASANFLEGPHDGHYYYNACRTPWRIGSSALYYNEEHARTLLSTFMSWATNVVATPGDFRAGYTLGGNPIGNYDTAAFIAPLGVAAMVTTNQAWVNDIFTYCMTHSEGYYEDSISLFSLITLSGNLWLWDTVDADLDQIADEWERHYMGNLIDLSDANHDQDEDGQSDLQEYIARTDPTDSNNLFRILSMSQADGLDQFSWMTAPDNTNLTLFTINYSTNLLEPNGGWHVATGTVEFAGSGTIRFSNNSAMNLNPIYYQITATNSLIAP